MVNHSSSLHHLAKLFRLRKLASLLQDIPLQKNDEFIGVRGVAEELSSSEPFAWRVTLCASNADFHCS